MVADGLDGSYLATRDKLQPCIEIRNAATVSYFNNPASEAKENLKAAR